MNTSTPSRLVTPSKTYAVLRSLHLYLGLLISPILLIFAFSILVINHWHPVTDKSVVVTEETHQIDHIPESLDSLDAVYSIMEQVDLSGWVTFYRHFEDQKEFRFVILRPTIRRNVIVDLETKSLHIKHQPNDLKATLVWLHVSPGPHIQNKNGFFTFLWWMLADGVVYSIIFLSVSGIYLWVFLRAERRTGLVLITLGLISFTLVLMTLLI